MTDFFPFILNHWLLFASVLSVLGLITIIETKASAVTQALTPELAIEWINHFDAAVLDTRNLDLFKQGHIIHAIHVDASDIEKHTHKIERYKNKPLILISHTDAEATKILLALKKQDFTQVKLLSRGMTAWKEAGMPIEKK